MKTRFILLALAVVGSVALPSVRAFSRQAMDAQSQSDGSSSKTNASKPNLIPGRVLYQPPPVYPKKARKNHIEGVVMLHAYIGVDGTIEKLDVVSGDPILVPAALDACRKWRYSPALLNGRPVKVDTTLTVTFQLNHGQ